MFTARVLLTGYGPTQMSWLARRNASRVQAGETGRDRAPIGLAQSRKPREGSWTWMLGRKPRSNILLLLSCEPNFASELLWLRPCNRTAIKRYGPLCLILLQFPYLRRSTVVPWNTFQTALQGAQGRRLMSTLSFGRRVQCAACQRCGQRQNLRLFGDRCRDRLYAPWTPSLQ